METDSFPSSSQTRSSLPSHHELWGLFWLINAMPSVKNNNRILIVVINLYESEGALELNTFPINHLGKGQNNLPREALISHPHKAARAFPPTYKGKMASLASSSSCPPLPLFCLGSAFHGESWKIHWRW